MIGTPLHDFKCDKCGHEERDLFFKLSKLPKIRRCSSCHSKESRQIFDQFGKAQINNTNSKLYGMWHPQFGEVLRSYEHKQELMKRYGVQEMSDTVRGVRSRSEENKQDDYEAEQRAKAPDVDWEDPEVREVAKFNTRIGVG